MKMKLIQTQTHTHTNIYTLLIHRCVVETRDAERTNGSTKPTISSSLPHILLWQTMTGHQHNIINNIGRVGLGRALKLRTWKNCQGYRVVKKNQKRTMKFHWRIWFSQPRLYFRIEINEQFLRFNLVPGLRDITGTVNTPLCDIVRKINNLKTH